MIWHPSPNHTPRRGGVVADMVVLQARDPIEAIRLKAARLFVVKAGKVIARAPRRESRLDLPGRQLTVDPAAYAPGE